MKSTSFNQDWKFWTDKNAFALVWNIPDFAKTVTLPHDAMLENAAHGDSPNGGNTGFRDGEVYEYVKIIRPENEDRGQTWMLKFEGIYMNAMVYVNGELAKKCPYGYTGFLVELNDFLKYGEENEIRVIVRNSGMTNSRWYSGGGIYRDAWLLTAGETYLVPEGVQVVTESLEEDTAVLKVETALKNRASRYRRLFLLTEICDREGQVVASDRIPVTLFEGETRRMTERLVVPAPKAWSAETPYLYRVKSSLYGEPTAEDGAAGGQEAAERVLLDRNTEHFGIRTLSVDAKRGFRVNGKTVKFRGACIHHDSGILGAATYYGAEYRRVRILKEAGFNAIRMSHHPAAPVLLRACDELGMYVMDEAFDMWQRCKSDNDYGLFFDERWESDVEAMVKKDFNHPSVVMYSVGNEIPEIGTNHGAKVCHEICEKIKRMDDTRYTLASINGVFAAGDKVPQIMGDLTAELAAEGRLDGNVNDFMTMMDAHMDKIVVHDAITERLDHACANTDIAGYNYMTARYELDGKERPNRVIVGSETYPPEIARNWALVEALDHVIGDFTWTGWDYIGEAGVGVPAYQFGEGGFGALFPCQLAYCGDMDITGFRRPASYFREVVFGLRRAPYITVQNPARHGQTLIKTPWVISDSMSSWTYPGHEGAPVIVELYAPGDEVELFCNGKSLGRKEAGKKAGYWVLFETVYEPGTLFAVSYEAGREIGRMELSTAEKETRLTLTVEGTVPGSSDGERLVYVAISNQDKKGTVADDRELILTAEVEGDAEILGFGSANPKTTYNYTGKETETFHGRAQLILKKKRPDASVKLWIHTGKESAELSL